MLQWSCRPAQGLFRHFCHLFTSMEAPAQVAVAKRVGPYALRQLLGKSSLGMTWLAWDPRTETEVLLGMPRRACATPQDLQAWRTSVGLADRLTSDGLARVVDTGSEGLWPYIVLERSGWQTLSEHIETSGWPSAEDAVAWIVQVVQILSVLHDGGLVHRDIGFHSVLVDVQGRATLAPSAIAAVSERPPGRDLVMGGLLLHGLLRQRPAHDVSDLPSAGLLVDQEIIRLPFNTPQPVSDALRAIVNRATERHPNRRFVGARGLLKALQGWQHTDAEGSNGAIAQLLGKVQRAGVLPALPGLTHRTGRIVSGDLSVDAMVKILSEDPALTFELLRLANAASGHASEEGVVLSPRRAVQLLGFDGVRRAAAGLKAWPGPLSEERSHVMRREMQRARRVAFASAALAPPGLHIEEPLVVALLHSLGRLLLHYHFPEEAVQIRALREGGMSRLAASCAVLGTDEESMALAVARHWGWREEALDLLRPLDPERVSSSRLGHADWLRAMATAAEESLQVAEQGGSPEGRNGYAAVALRFNRLLGATAGELQEAVQRAEQRLTEMVAKSRGARIGNENAPMPTDDNAGRAASTGR